MQGLMLHCGASHVTRSDVDAVKTPAPVGQHYPIPHRLLIDHVHAQLDTDALEIVEEAHALTKDGARYFGLTRVKSRGGDSALLPADTSIGRDYDLVVGLRNSHDQSAAASLVCGNQVFVCDNLAMSGEVLIGRKHTRFIRRDLPLLIPRAFGRLGHERQNMERRVAAYKGADLSDKDAHDLIVRAMVDSRIFPPSRLPDVVGQWRAPAHEEFEPRTAWSLFNAFTEVAKPRRPDAQAALETLSKRTRNLQGFLDAQLTLTFETAGQALEREVRDIAAEDVTVRADR